MFVRPRVAAAAHARRPAQGCDGRHIEPEAPLAAAGAAPRPRSRRHPRQRADAPAQAGRAGMAGTILAAAGLARLGQPELASFAFAFPQMLPAVGQGSLAIEARAGDARRGARHPAHPRAHRSGSARRAQPHARAAGGAARCRSPATRQASQAPDERGTTRLLLRAFVGSVDGARTVRGELAGPAPAPEGLGIALADDLLARGADQILAEVRGAG